MCQARPLFVKLVRLCGPLQHAHGGQTPTRSQEGGRLPCPVRTASAAAHRGMPGVPGAVSLICPENALPPGTSTSDVWCGCQGVDTTALSNTCDEPALCYLRAILMTYWTINRQPGPVLSCAYPEQLQLASWRTYTEKFYWELPWTEDTVLPSHVYAVPLSGFTCHSVVDILRHIYTCQVH